MAALRFEQICNFDFGIFEHVFFVSPVRIHPFVIRFVISHDGQLDVGRNSNFVHHFFTHSRVSLPYRWIAAAGTHSHNMPLCFHLAAAAAAICRPIVVSHDFLVDQGVFCPRNWIRCDLCWTVWRLLSCPMMFPQLPAARRPSRVSAQ